MQHYTDWFDQCWVCRGLFSAYNRRVRRQEWRHEDRTNIRLVLVWSFINLMKYAATFNMASETPLDHYTILAYTRVIFLLATAKWLCDISTLVAGRISTSLLPSVATRRRVSGNNQAALPFNAERQERTFFSNERSFCKALNVTRPSFNPESISQKCKREPGFYH